MVTKKRTIIVLASFFLIMAWAISPSSVPAKEKFVNALFTGPLTGPGAAVVLPIFEGWHDYLTEVNSKGGVDGIKINLVNSDDRYDVSRAMSFYQRTRRLPRRVVLISAGAPQTYGIHPLITRDKLPLIGSAARFTAKPGYVFLLCPPYQDQTGAALDWMIEDWKKKGKPGMPTVGTMGWAGGAGKEALNGADQYAKQKGIKLLPPEFFPPGSLKYDTWLTRLANNGADYIYLGVIVDPDQSFALRDAHNLGLTKKIQFVGGSYSFLTSVGLKLVSPEVFEGAVTLSPFLIGDECRNHPMAKLFTKYRKKPLIEINPGYLWGVGIAKAFEKGLRIAYKEVGYEKLKGETLYPALQKVQGDVTGGILGKITWGPKSRKFTRDVKAYRITKGKHVPLGGWRKTPDCIGLGKFK